MNNLHAIENELIKNSYNWKTGDDSTEGLTNLANQFNTTVEEMKTIYFDLSKKMTEGY
jgi:hypothetical protein